MASQQTITTVERISTFLMTRYTRLNKLISFAFEGSTDVNINLYIDLYSIYKTILSRSFRTDMKNYMGTVPAIINICAHYRQYFRQLGVASKIFLISSYNCPEINRKFVAGYNKTMMDKLQNPAMLEMLEYNLNLLDILCPYLEDIHFIRTEFESSVMMDQIIQNEYKKSGKYIPSLIITSDILPAQLCVKYDSVGLIRVKKYNGEDLSTIISPIKYGLTKNMNTFNQVVYGDSPFSAPETTKERVSPPNFILLLTLTSFRSRYIKTIMNSGTAIKLINKCANSNKLDINGLYAIAEAMEVSNILDRYPKEILLSRYNALSIDYMDPIFKNSLETEKLNYNNLIDPGAIQMINSKYFANNPIDVFRL